MFAALQLAMSHHHLPPIELDDTVLDEVTGGVTSSTSASTDPQLASALQGITSQIASLGKANGNSGSSLETLLPMMLMMGMGGGGGSCGCGCGMANCSRR
jgi:hypothetical protein